MREWRRLLTLVAIGMMGMMRMGVVLVVVMVALQHVGGGIRGRSWESGRG